MQIVTLTTDYGTSDYYVAELKGAILSKAPETTLIDVSHEIDSYDITQAAFFIGACYKRFPEGSIHLISVYNYYDGNVSYLITKKDGHFFIAPNNGVVSLIFAEWSEEEVVEIEFDKGSLSQLYAHAIAAISHGLSINELGSPMERFSIKMGIQPVVTSSQIRVTIIHIDHYENVIVNLKRDLFDKIGQGRPFSLYYKQTEPITELSINYGSVDVGETLALFNSSGYMEIAVNMGKASTMYNLNKDETIQINFL